MDSSELDDLIKNYEFEYQNIHKLIQKELQEVDAIEKDISTKKKEVEHYQEVTSQLDENTKCAHKQFLQNRDNYESLKRTSSVLSEHEEALIKKVETLCLSREQERNERAAINEHYENLWQEYESKYKQLHHYKILEQKKEEVRAVEKKMEMLQEEEEKLKSAIEERKRTYTTLSEFVVEVAKKGLENMHLAETIEKTKLKTNEINSQIQQMKTMKMQKLQDLEEKKKQQEEEAKRQESLKKKQESIQNLPVSTMGMMPVISNSTASPPQENIATESMPVSQPHFVVPTIQAQVTRTPMINRPTIHSPFQPQHVEHPAQQFQIGQQKVTRPMVSQSAIAQSPHLVAQSPQLIRQPATQHSVQSMLNTGRSQVGQPAQNVAYAAQPTARPQRRSPPKLIVPTTPLMQTMSSNNTSMTTPRPAIPTIRTPRPVMQTPLLQTPVHTPTTVARGFAMETPSNYETASEGSPMDMNTDSPFKIQQFGHQDYSFKSPVTPKHFNNPIRETNDTPENVQNEDQMSRSLFSKPFAMQERNPGLNMFGDGPSTVHSRENHSIFSPGNSSILSPQLSFDVDTGASAMDDGSGDAGSLFSQNTPKRSESDPFSMFDSNPKTPNTPGNNFRLDFYSMGEQEEGGGFMLFGNRDNNDDSNSASTGFCFD